MDVLFRPTAQLKISLTPDCNNNCPICLNKTTRARNGQQNKLSINKIKQLINEACDLGMVGTYWTGGEPLIEYEKLLELSEYSSEKGLIPTVITNGGLIGAYGNYKKLNEDLLKRAGLFHLSTTQIVKSLKEAGLERVYFSVDSSHTMIESVNSDEFSFVPTEVVSQAISGFLDEGYGKIHELDAIGHQLRVTATSSGVLSEPTNQIIEDVMEKVGVKLKKTLSDNASIFENEKGKIFLRRLNVAKLGDAETLGDDILENRTGKKLFNIECSHFIPREHAYDNGKHHGDLFIDYNGIVYTCGDHAYPVGNVLEESLTSIIEGINKRSLEGEYGINRTVFHSLLILSRKENVGNSAIGEAFRMIHSKYPALVHDVKTQCGGCSCLGHKKDLQKAFLKVFQMEYS